MKFFNTFSSKNTRLANLLINFFNLSLSKRFTKPTQLILRLSESLKIRFLGTFSLSLSLSIYNLSILQALHTITKSLNGETVGVSLSGLGKVIFLARPEFSNTSITLGRILNGFNLGKLGVNLINFSLKTLRKGVRLSGRTNELEKTIGILDTFSLCDSLQTLSISILGLCLNIFSLNTLQSGFAERRSTRHNVRHRVVLIRTLRRNRTTVGLRNIALRGTHRLNGRTFNKWINTSGGVSGALSDRRFEFVISPRGIVFHTLVLGLGILTSLCDLKIIHLLLPFTIFTVHATGRDGRTGGTGATKDSANSKSGFSEWHN